MKNKSLKRSAYLAVAALVLILGLTVGEAMAYFTTYATAEGGIELDLGFTETDIDEEVVNGKKEIALENTGDYDCYVRMRALTGDAYKDSIQYSEPNGEGNWTPGADGFYYYSEILPAGQKTTQIDVSFEFPTKEPDDFNVIIIQECTPVRFDENGAPFADWEAVADVSSSYYN